MKIEEIRSRLGLKPREEFFREKVLPRLEHVQQPPNYELLTLGTGRTTEMLLRAAAYALIPSRKDIILVGHSGAYALSLYQRLRRMLRGLEREDAFERISFSSTFSQRANTVHFIDHAWGEFQELREGCTCAPGDDDFPGHEVDCPVPAMWG